MKLLRNLLLALALVLGACAAPVAERAPWTLTIAAINDFHGNLELPASGVLVVDAATQERTRTPAGGVARLATVIERLRAGNSRFAFVSAGDLVGASPLVSGWFDDEPTIEAMNHLGLDFNGVGNHEFDRGRAELQRLQSGGCPRAGCKSGTTFEGAKFGFLAANVIWRDTGATLFPAYAIREYAGVRVAFIGVTLKETPAAISRAAAAGLEFTDEAEAVNRLVPELRRAGAEVIILLIHQGGNHSGSYNECADFRGPIIGIAQKIDRAVDVIISGHTHQAYICRLDGRLVTSAGSYGRFVTEIRIGLDAAARQVTTASAINHVVRSDIPEHPLLAALAARQARMAAALDRSVGRVAQPITNFRNADGESALGQILADAHLEATADAGAEVAFMNPGGVRTTVDMKGGGEVSYAALYAVQPFGNHLVTMTLTGAQILRLLEQQWHGQVTRILQVSKGSGFAWDASRPWGERIVRSSVIINGRPLDAQREYRVTVNNFLADGGDNFTTFPAGRDRVSGVQSLDALIAYFGRHSPIAPGTERRVRQVSP